MAKDYAKYRGPSSRTRKSKEKAGGGILFALVAAAVIGVAILGVYAYKHTGLDVSRQKLVSWVSQVKLLLSHKKIGTSLPAKNASPQQANQQPEIRFNFYTELPNMQVNLPVVEQAPNKQASVSQKKSTANPKKIESVQPVKEMKAAKDESGNTERYILQVGVFKNETAAGQMRISLVLAGVDADIVKSIQESQVTYRLQKGPYATLAQAREAQKQLEVKGIMGLIKKVSQKG